MFKYLLLAFSFCCYANSSNSQTLNNPGRPDSLFPISSRYLEGVSGNMQYDDITEAWRLQKASGKYLVGGDFTSLASNQGSALIVDSASSFIFNDHKYRVNGLVKAAVPDGQGGFYIAGEFTRIGDSTRRYLAQINSQGKPTAWNPSPDNVVNALEKRNDTLFIAGAFKNIRNKLRNCFALFSISGDTLCPTVGVAPFPNMVYINAFVLQQDTIIFGGKSTTSDRNIRKFNFRNNVSLTWQPAYVDYTDVKFIQLSPDASVVIYGGYYNGYQIRGAGNRFGELRYTIKTTMYWPSEFLGYLRGLQISGNKAYAVGSFEHLIRNGEIYFRKGFFAFDPVTGNILPDQPVINGYTHFLQERKGKLIISGKFTKVNGVNRHNFAVIDTGSFTLGNWQLSPSDPIATMSFVDDKVFVAGMFGGIYSSPRTNFAAIDSAGKNIANWAPPALPERETKKILVRGDSVFVITQISPMDPCFYYSNPNFRVYSLSTGASYGAGSLNASVVHDFVIDGNYLYAAVDHGMRRYALPSVNLDFNWGFNTEQAQHKYDFQELKIEGDKIYGVGDTRRFTCANSLQPKRGYVGVYSKATGLAEQLYFYQGANPDYDNIFLHHAVKMGNKLFIQGGFSQLRDSARRNFACIDLSTGNLTAWKPNFPLAPPNVNFSWTSELKSVRGNIWFGGMSGPTSDGGFFKGFAAIDTATGNLVSQPLNLKSVNLDVTYNISAIVHDFIITDTELVVAGRFDTVNNSPSRNLAFFKLTGINQVSLCPSGASNFVAGIPGSSYQWEMNDGSGFVPVNNNSNFSGAQSATLQVANIPSAWYNYSFRCQVNGSNYSDIFQIKMSNTWTGAINSAWENPGNWSCLTVPDANTDVIIPAGNVIVNASTTLGSVSLFPGANLTVAPGVIFTVLH